MGTHAMIGFYDNETGNVQATYVHYDGYLGGVGRTLVENYNTPDQARAVATAGYLSGLTEDLTESLQESVHKDQPAIPYESVEQFMKNGYDYYGADYVYLFDGTAWFFAEPGTKFEEVEMNLNNELTN